MRFCRFLAIGLLCSWGAAPALAQPVHDDCPSAIPIAEGTFAFDTTGATLGAPPACGDPAPDVWYAYTAGCTGLATIETTDFLVDDDTILEVSDACGGIVLACNDDILFPNLLSRVTFASAAGTTYLVRVSGWDGSVGTGSFTVACAAAAVEICDDAIDNDLDGAFDCDDADCIGAAACIGASSDFCVGAVPIGDGTFAFDTTLATISAPGATCGEDAPDVWFEYTAPCTGEATIESTDFSVDDDTVIEVLAACGGAVIACDDDGVVAPPLLSIVNFPTVAGTAYLVRISGWDGSVGTGTFTVACTAMVAEICGDSVDNDFDGAIDCADADCAAFPACATPSGDECLGAAAIGEGSFPFDTTAATISVPDASCGEDAPDVWFQYTAGCTGLATVESTSFTVDDDTVIEVLAACGGAILACDDDGVANPPLLSTVTFPVVAGTSYLVRISGWDGAIGTGTFGIACAPTASEDCLDGVDNDLDGFVDCADHECACTGACPAPLTGDECCNALVATTGANAFSTVGLSTSGDPLTPAQCPGTVFGSSANDVWFSWTAPLSGTAVWDTCQAGGFDTDVTIYEGADCLTKVQIACNGDDPAAPLGCQAFSSGGSFAATAGVGYLIRIGSFDPGVTGTGTLNIALNCAPAVSNLTASFDCATGDVALGWDPTAAFTGFEIARDGATVATLPGGSTGFVDLGVANGTHDYDVIGTCAGGGTSTAGVAVTVASPAGIQDLVLRGELPNGLVDSVAALTAELTALGRTFLVVDGGIGAYPCSSFPFEIIWNLNGTNSDTIFGGGAGRNLTVADGAALLAQHVAGAGIYLESGDQWGFGVVATDFDQFDGVDSAFDDGDDSFTAMDGADSLLGLSVADLQNVGYTQDLLPGVPGNFTDQLIVAAADPGLAAAAAIWSRDDALGAPYVTGVYGQGIAPAGSVISQSWEFGGFGGNRNDLASRYIAALGGGAGQPEFERGDTNNDGGINIADAVYLLGALFPPPGGSPNVLACRDTGDGNDDGGINIADAVAVLSSLFGSPTVPLPAPNGACGVDPTTDSLDCLGYSHCP